MAGITLRSGLVLLVFLAGVQSQAGPSKPWNEKLKHEIQAIDEETPGNMGVYVKRLRDGSELKYESDRKWYLASTVKLPIAIAVLQKVGQGSLSLRQTHVLRESDYVDGTGDLLWMTPGTKVSIETMLEKMLTQSDSTAADLLIRQVGLVALNQMIREKTSDDTWGPISTLLQVRYDAYSELHPRANELSNMDFVELKKAKSTQERLLLFQKKLKLHDSQLKARGIDEAFERYYQKGFNSGTLTSFGLLLEKLVRGQLLSSKHTEYILGLMENMVTGEKRIKAGLTPKVRFAQKTGTQVRRACNVGVLRAKTKAARQETAVVAACLEKFEEYEQAENALRRLGESISRANLP